MDEHWLDISRGWRISEQAWQELQKYITRRAGEIALALLNSNDPRERETGALAAGQLRLVAAESRLRELLEDESGYMVLQARRSYRCYFIRKAAAEALKAMSKDPGPVVTEDPPATQSTPATSTTL